LHDSMRTVGSYKICKTEDVPKKGKIKRLEHQEGIR
jgi:hypothetical protein